MSTPLISGIALTGQPRDYANVAAKRQADAAKPKVDKEMERAMKVLDGALNVSVHDGWNPQTKERNLMGLANGLRMIEAGDYNGFRQLAQKLYLANDADSRSTKILQEIESPRYGSTHLVPEGFPSLVKSSEYMLASMPKKIEMLDEFFGRDENKIFRGIYSYGLNDAGGFVLNVDHSRVGRVDPMKEFSAAINRIGTMAFDEELGRRIQQKFIRLGKSITEQDRYMLAEEVMVEKLFELMASNPSMRNNLARIDSRFIDENPDVVVEAATDFVNNNSRMWTEKFTGITGSGGGSGSRFRLDPVDAIEQIPMNVAGVGNVNVSAATSAFSTTGKVSMNARNSLVLGEKDQFTRTSMRDGVAKQDIRITSATILPVYTGDSQTFEFMAPQEDPSRPGKRVSIKLEKGMPIPLEYLEQIEDRIRASGTKIPYRYEAFFAAETGKEERAGGRTTFFPADESNRNAVAEGSRQARLHEPNWAEYLFPDNYQLLSKKGVLGGTGGGGSSPQPPAPRQQTTPAPQGQQQQAPASGGRQGASEDMNQLKKLLGK
jgi:hypothetical protein